MCLYSYQGITLRFLSGIFIVVKCRTIRFIVPVKGNLNIRKILRTFFLSRGWINNRDILLRKYTYIERERTSPCFGLPPRNHLSESSISTIFFETYRRIDTGLIEITGTYLYIHIYIYIVCKYILLFKYINSLQCFIISSVGSNV